MVRVRILPFGFMMKGAGRILLVSKPGCSRALSLQGAVFLVVNSIFSSFLLFQRSHHQSINSCDFLDTSPGTCTEITPIRCAKLGLLFITPARAWPLFLFLAKPQGSAPGTLRRFFLRPSEISGAAGFPRYFTHKRLRSLFLPLLRSPKTSPFPAPCFSVASFVLGFFLPPFPSLDDKAPLVEPALSPNILCQGLRSIASPFKPPVVF